MPSKKFCAAPWVGSVFALSGEVHPCCQNGTSFGSWEGKLEETWNSVRAREFRQKMLEGIYPDNLCEVCYVNGRSVGLRHYLLRPLIEYCTIIKKYDQNKFWEVARLRELLDDDDNIRPAETILRNFFFRIKEHEKNTDFPEEYYLALSKLRVLGEIVEDFLLGNTAPRHIAPHRGVSVILRCNARCIHCPGKFTGVIERGSAIEGRGYVSEMTEAQIEQSLMFSESIIDFIMYGSEFLFYKNWEKLAIRLKKIGVKFRLSSNGILLNEKNIKLLIDNKYIAKLNMSLDGASKEVMEEIRVNVSYERVARNMQFLFQYLDEKSYPLAVSFTFCLMKRNYHDLPKFVELISQYRGKSSNTYVSILVQLLVMRGGKPYEDLVREEHHTKIDKSELVEAFNQMLVQSKKHNIDVFILKYTLAEFIEKGCPLPEYTFLLVSDDARETSFV